MARQVHRLSSKTVEKEKQPGYYCDGGGLYLQVSPAETRSWIFRYTRNGKTREMGLGPCRDISLAEARGKASEQRKHLLDGRDPIEVRDGDRAAKSLAKSKSLTFADCAARYIKAKRAGWRNEKHVDQWTNTLATYAEPVLGSLPVSEIDTGLVMRVLEPIWTTKPETASRVRGRIERILDWAKVHGYRQGENPAKWRGHLDKALPEQGAAGQPEHHAALPYDELPAFLELIRGQEGTAARALEFAILTAARTGEVIGATRGELDLEKAVWTVPAGRMKGKREHRVPLSARAIEIIKAQPKAGYLFPGGKEGAPLSNMAMLELLRRMDRNDITVHGFRSTFRDWAAERTNYPREVCEMALAHSVGDKTEKAYQRGDMFEKRRRLMQDWEKFCKTPTRGGNVHPMRKAS